MVRVLLACDKFKGSLTAAQVAEHLERGMLGAGPPGLQVEVAPVADGGDGTVDAAMAAGFRSYEHVVTGPTGTPVAARFAGSGDTAIVEMARASGLSRLPDGRPAPLTATSYGTGELLAHAGRSGFERVLLGVGGSACTDGGAGMVTALGAVLTDTSGDPLPPGGAALRSLATLDASALTLPGVREVVLGTDVDNPLLGPQGAAPVYGPQKGASAEDVRVLTDGLHRWSEVVGRTLDHAPNADTPGAGAAGGVGYAAMAFLGARVRPGVQAVLELAGFAERAKRADLIITGEGSLDEQTLRGKAPAGVAAFAGATRVHAVAGRCVLPPERLHEVGIEGVSTLSELEPDLDRSIAYADVLLHRIGEDIGRRLAREAS